MAKMLKDPCTRWGALKGQNNTEEIVPHSSTTDQKTTKDQQISSAMNKKASPTAADQPPGKGATVVVVAAPKAEMENLICMDSTSDWDEAESKVTQTPKALSLKTDRLVAAPGKDDVDALSTYSLYMESDFLYYFQHPWGRLLVAYMVTLCNFLIYAEDPVVDSFTESNIPVIGNNFAFLFTRYPPNAWSLLKVLLWIAGILVGIVTGKMLFHQLIFNKLFRLKMFSNDKGSWMTMLLVTILSVFFFSGVYNLALMIGGGDTSAYHISAYMGITNNIFMKVAAIGTWCGDFLTAWMVTDMMLQERLYPNWAVWMRKWWKKGYNRIVLFWIIIFFSSFMVIFLIAADYIQWDKLNRDFLHTNELTRAFLASFILIMDIVIVMQDWDFPHFVGLIDIKLPGFNQAHFHFSIPRVLKSLNYWHVHISAWRPMNTPRHPTPLVIVSVVSFGICISSVWFLEAKTMWPATGKWFNYGILFIVINLDLNMWKNQIFYDPYTYGHYVDSQGRIYVVRDDFSLSNANHTLLSFEYRNNHLHPVTGKCYIETDIVMNSRYYEYPLAVKAIAFIPSISVFVVFGMLVWLYGRMPKPTKEDPYGGRLKVRNKRRFSFRLKSLRTHFHAPPAVLTLSHRMGLMQEEMEKYMAERVVDKWKEDAKGEGDESREIVEDSQTSFTTTTDLASDSEMVTSLTMNIAKV